MRSTSPAGLLPLLGFCLIVACENEPIDPSLTGVDVTVSLPDSVEVLVGSSARLDVQFSETARMALVRTALVWTTSDAAVAVVDSTGAVWGLQEGDAWVAVRVAKAGGSRDTTHVRVSAPGPAPGGSVVTGRAHSCALDDSGRAFCWGDDEFGQLGNGDPPGEPEDWAVPVPVSGALSFTRLTAGAEHTCGLDLGGRAYCWGDNGSGTLGDGSTQGRATPVPVATDLRFEQISAGFGHTCGLTPDGTAYCWGSGSAVGNGSDGTVTRPVPVSGGLHFSEITTGSHTCGLTRNDGHSYCWGAWKRFPDYVEPPPTTPVLFNEGFSFTHVDAGMYRTCALEVGGGARCWGSGGSVGDSGGEPAEAIAFVRLTVGSAYGCGLIADGSAYCWGENTAGELGDGTLRDRSGPVAVVGGLRFTEISAGLGFTADGFGQHTCGATGEGIVYCWGDGGDGQLGSGVRAFAATPVAAGAGIVFESVSAGGEHTCGVGVGQGAYCWGANSAGQLGRGTGGDASSPIELQGGLSLRQVSAGELFSCGLDAAGAAYCWGRNHLGQLGDGTTTNRLAPVRVTGDILFDRIVAGSMHACGTASDGNTYCWGGNWAGQLGNGVSLDFMDATSEPVLVATELTFTRLAAGGSHTCALTAAGDAYCWGGNEAGELGNGEVRNSGRYRWTTPGRVNGDIQFLRITAGGTHTCGITPDGNAYCWGRDGHGQLGDGAPAARQLEPAPVAGGYSFDRLAAGYTHTCGVAEGSVLCWGDHLLGRLGDGGSAQRLQPVEVSLPASALPVVDLTAGKEHSCAIAATGAVYCWGSRTRGQLGDGLFARRSVPGPVARPFSP